MTAATKGGAAAIEPEATGFTGRWTGKPQDGMALCLSGGGSRALLFHVGSLWRLNELGLLARLKRISSVSGGSIAAGILASHWDEIGFGPDGVGASFEDAFVAHVRRFASSTIDIGVFLRGVLLPGSTAEALSRVFAQQLFGERTLQDLPADDDPAHPAPRFVINASNLQSTAVFRFSRPYAGDYRIGRIRRPDFRLADAVAASSAFPPFFGPLRLDLTRHVVEADTGSDLHEPPYTTHAMLVDGGVYDNLGLETIFKRYRTLLVSNGGGHTVADPGPATDWARQTLRVMQLLDGQVRNLRARMLMDAYTSHPPQRHGAYWGMRTDIGAYRAPRSAAVSPSGDPCTCCPADASRRRRTGGPGTTHQLGLRGHRRCRSVVHARDIGTTAPVPVSPRGRRLSRHRVPTTTSGGYHARRPHGPKDGGPGCVDRSGLPGARCWRLRCWCA